MWTDFITALLSSVALIFSLVNFIISYKKTRTLHMIKDADLKILEEECKAESTDFIDFAIRTVAALISSMYPESNPYVSVKLIIKSNKKELSEKSVATIRFYPEKRDSLIYKIQDNTDFSSIVKNNSRYFFVSDLKKYSALNTYKNSANDYIQKYNTSIVCPIQKDKRNAEDIIGFLCVDSKQKFENVKKNKEIIEFIISTASRLYEYINTYKKEEM